MVTNLSEMANLQTTCHMVLEMPHCSIFQAKTSHVFCHYAIACNIEELHCNVEDLDIDLLSRTYEYRPREANEKVHMMQLKLMNYHNYLPLSTSL